jgi:peptide-methionine (R)-S-oxide reductase
MGLAFISSHLIASEKVSDKSKGLKNDKATVEAANMTATEMSATEMSDEQWKEKLTEEQYRVLREKGTERAGSGEFNLHFAGGNYSCAGCGALLFSSETKYESHCGWPSFYDVESGSAVKEIKDYSHGMVRTEVICSNCGGHLGHVFSDGPKDKTGLRYCINSVSIQFKSK